MMGLTESHYNACRAVTWYKSVALGDMQSLKNNFGWYKVLINFPGVALGFSDRSASTMTSTCAHAYQYAPHFLPKWDGIKMTRGVGK